MMCANNKPKKEKGIEILNNYKNIVKIKAKELID
jgi:hypothetical protein